MMTRINNGFDSAVVFRADEVTSSEGTLVGDERSPEREHRTVRNHLLCTVPRKRRLRLTER